MSDNKEFRYNTDVPTGRRTVDKPEREFTERDERALEALLKIVNINDVRVAENRAAMESPHLGDKFSQRQSASKLLAGRSYQAMQAWLNSEPMPAGMVEWLLDDLQRIDARKVDRVVQVQFDEIAIIVKAPERAQPARKGEFTDEQLQAMSDDDFYRHAADHPRMARRDDPGAEYGARVGKEWDRRHARQLAADEETRRKLLQR